MNVAAAPRGTYDNNVWKMCPLGRTPGSVGRQTMNATLLVLSDNTIKRQVALKLPCVLGRSREADVIVAHPLISRRHCELSETDGLLMLRDLVSLNGTMIGGRRIASAPLLPGAEFTIGPLTFRVQYAFSGDRQSLPPTCFVDEPGAGVEFTEIAADPYILPATPAQQEPPAKVPGLSESQDTEPPDFMAWTDADVEEITPAIILDPEESDGPPPFFPQPVWPQVGPTEYPAQPAPVFDGQEQYPTLPTGGRTRESPWATESPQIEPAQAAANDTPAANTAAAKQPQPRKRPPIPPQSPNHGDEAGPEAPSFLEGLR